MKILLALSDPTLRHTVQDWISALPDYEVYAVSDPAEASRYAASLPDLAWMLLEYPSLRAPHAASELQAAFPGVRILLLDSGAAPTEAAAPDPFPVLRLPASARALLDILRVSEKPPATALEEGSRLGAYRILQEETVYPWGRTFSGLQTDLNRPVTLTAAAAGPALPPDEREFFFLEAGVRARVLHPLILTVYEAGEVAGWLYCALERVSGATLESLLQARQKLPIPRLLQTARAVATALQYLNAEGILHLPLEAAHVLLPFEGPPRLANLATPHPTPTGRQAADLGTLGKCLLALLPAQTPASLRALLQRTQPGSPEAFTGWEAFLRALKTWEAAEKKAGRLLAEENPPPRRSRREKQSREKKRTRAIVIACALLSAALLVWSGLPGIFAGLGSTPGRAPLPGQAVLEAGTFLVGAGDPVPLTAFTIDQTEITNRQYAAFLRWLSQNPSQSRKHAHPDQPADWSHTPSEWTGFSPPPSGTQSGEALWELPVSGVGWWDAYAFAEWAGRSLPSAEEWEAAARGPRGLLFPWGDDRRAGLAHCAGAEAGPLGVGALRDLSPTGALGMAGNVAEWTGSAPKTGASPAPGKHGVQAVHVLRVVKGGHFLAPLQSLDNAAEFAPGTRLPQLGFRTRSRKTS